MLYYDRIEVSEGIDVNKVTASKEVNNCGIFWIKCLSFSQMSAMGIMMY